MAPSSIEEIKRLEQLVNQNIGATRGLSNKVQKLSDELIELKTQRQHDKETADKTAEQIEKLTTAINSLNETFANISGKAQGVSLMAKTFWTITGGIVIASILWLSNTIVELKTQVAVLQSKENKK